AWTPGAMSGLAGAQITATAMVADMRRSAVPSSVASLPTNGRNQDVVSMGTMASRVACEQADRLSGVLAIHAIALRQLAFLRECGRADGPVVQPPAWCPPIDGLKVDRALHGDIERVAADFIRPTDL
ncbi:MAG: aromatic amino acid lyase, partial [Planctomycetota bacterium]